MGFKQTEIHSMLTRNGGSKMADTSSSFFGIYDVDIMAYLLLLKVIYILANFLTFTLL